MERTTALMELKMGARFTWGQSIKLHEIGPYAVMEYHPWSRNNNNSFRSGIPNMNAVEFYTWVNGAACHHSFASLDAALAGCIAYRHEGCNHRADDYFMRTIAENGAA